MESSSSSSPPSASSYFDIETYISRYQPKSNITLQRLLYLSCITNDNEAARKGFQLLEQRLKTKGNTKMYREVFGNNDGDGDEISGMDVDYVDPEVSIPGSRATSNSAAVVEPDPDQDFNKPTDIPFDVQFIQTVETNASNQLQTLEANLNNSQAHLSKDSIRNSYLALAKFYQSRGESEEAYRYFQRAKDYCFTSGSINGGSGAGGGSSSAGGGNVTNNQTSEIILSMAECGLECQKGHYDELVIQLTTTDTGSSNSLDCIYNSKLKCVKGIAYLNKGDYYLAAMTFVSIVQADFTNQYNAILSAEDIALYGGILGLIVLDRPKIESCLEVEAWHERLELVPNLQDAIKCYMKADYGGCLQLIEPLKEYLVRDLFLSPHVDKLWTMMREKCILQYFQPYSSVSLVTMKDSFGFQNVDEVEDVVASLIESKRLVGAKIDGVNRTLTRITAKGFEQKKRQMMMKKVSAMGDRLINEVEDMVLRLSCLENDVVVNSDSRNRRTRSSGMEVLPFESIGDSSDEENYAV